MSLMTDKQRNRVLAAMEAAARRVLKEQGIPAVVCGHGFSSGPVDRLHVNFCEPAPPGDQAVDKGECQ